MDAIENLIAEVMNPFNPNTPPKHTTQIKQVPKIDKFYRDHRQLINRHNSSPSSIPSLWIQLGRYGDIINILPLLYDEYISTGQKQNLLVAKPYLSLLDGTSYIIPHVWEGDFADLSGAMKKVQNKFRNFKTTQVYARTLGFQKRTDSFSKESWDRVGMINKWNTLPLIFDKRDLNRERSLVKKFIKDKPAILVATNGISSPFHHSSELLNLLRSELGKTYDIIDLSAVFCERFYDLLGLYDASKYLVTIDTAHMHLARGSRIKTIALITDGPTPWHSSAEIPGQIYRFYYSQFKDRKDNIVRVIKSTSANSNVVTAEGQRMSEQNRHLIHIYNDYSPRIGDAAPRHNFAKSTWQTEYKDSNWLPLPITMEMLPRNSKTSLKTTRSLPFIKDLIDIGVKSASINDVIVLTNDDISFVKGLGKFLLEVTDQRAAWINRFDFRSLTSHLTTEQCRTGVWCVGTDLFAFTPTWWKNYKSKFPDMLLSCEAWDWIFRELVQLTGGFEIHAMIYHQMHASFWYNGNNRQVNVGNKHNQRLAKQWLSAHGKSLRELGNV